MDNKLLKTFFRAYPIAYGLVWKENLLLSFVDIFHGLSFAALVIVTQRFFDAMAGCLDGGGMKEQVIFLSALLIACQVAAQILNGAVNFYADVVVEKGYGKVCSLIQKKLAKAAPVNYEKNSFLDDVDKADQGAREVCSMVDTVNSVFTFYVPYFALMGYYMYRLNPVLVMALLLVFFPVLVTNYAQMHFGDVIEQKTAPVRRQARAYEKTLTTLDCYKETRVLGAARYFINLYKKSISKWNRVFWRERKKEALINLGLNIFSFLAYGAILVMLARLCAAGRISAGSFAAVVSAIDVMFLLMEEIFRDSLGNVSKNMGCVRNLLNLLDLPEDCREDVVSSGNEIMLNKVTFRYPEADRDCLNDISFRINGNELVAIVGANGSGKTTLSKIIMGIYEPDKGEVFIGGERMGKSRRCFRNISAVFQKFNRYQLSLKDNVVISNLARKENYMDAVAEVDGELKGLGKMILSREFDGIDLSGGQWQKVAIARGIYRRCKELADTGILVLDEPTSAIDPLHEGELYRIFLKAAEGKTCIVVTHRLGFARIADRILVLKDGKVVENGKHEELLKQEGEYFKLWSAQAGWYETDR